MILTNNVKAQSGFFALGVDDVIYQHCESPDLIAARVLANMRHLFGTHVNIDKLVIDIANKKIEYDCI